MMGHQVQYHTDYKYYRNYAQNDFLAVVRRAGFTVAMVAMAMTIAHHQHPRQPQHQCRKYKQPWFNPRRQYWRMRKFRRKQWYNRQHQWQYTAKQVRGQRRNNSNLYGFVFHLLFPFVHMFIRPARITWRSHRGSNLDLILRRNLFYPVELWERGIYFIPWILILQVVIAACIIPPT